jgi:hypothetical protein
MYEMKEYGDNCKVNTSIKQIDVTVQNASPKYLRKAHSSKPRVANIALTIGPLDALVSIIASDANPPSTAEVRKLLQRPKHIGSIPAPIDPARIECGKAPCARTMPLRLSTSSGVPLSSIKRLLVVNFS